METSELVPLEEKILDPLRWIVDVLRRHKVPFQITGGLAARLYGAQREIFDIDLDVPEDSFQDILADVAPYISFGPAFFQDESWRVYLLTLNYKGQDIDLGGAYQTQIFDSTRKEWVDSPAHLDAVTVIPIADLELPVVNREDLIRYKSLLNRDVDVQDIKGL